MLREALAATGPAAFGARVWGRLGRRGAAARPGGRDGRALWGRSASGGRARHFCERPSASCSPGSCRCRRASARSAARSAGPSRGRALRRLRALRDAAEAWGEGRLDARYADDGRDELGDLGAALDRMAGALRSLVGERERRALLRDPHDGVKQYVFAGTLQLGAARALWAARPDEALGQLGEAEGALRRAQLELAALLRGEGSLADARGLLGALEAFAGACLGAAGPARLVSEGEPLPVPAGLAGPLFRIGQEAIANAARHSGCRRLCVRLRPEPGPAIALEVEDYGRGFDPGAVTGFGPRSMRERAEALGARLELVTGPGGTLVRVRAGAAP
jgi:signal transduction histidine kinase